MINNKLVYAQKTVQKWGKDMEQKRRVLVIIPAYNEAENIVHVVRHMTETAPQYDYLVINDGSTDNTPDRKSVV